MIHHNVKINRIKVARDIAYLIIFILLLCIVGSYYESRKYKSGCPDDGCFSVKVVYASEEVSELEQIVGYITKVFAPEGKHVVIQAINCFYSESGLRNDAIGKNNNGSNDVGVAQINSIHGMSIKDRMNYKKNIDKAYKIYKSRGNWSAWYGRGCI